MEFYELLSGTKAHNETKLRKYSLKTGKTK